jgi:CubicO group peptidase (beta-lactamase class C family)
VSITKIARKVKMVGRIGAHKQCIAGLLLALVLCHRAFAWQSPSSSLGVDAVVPSIELTAADLEQFLDERVPGRLEQGNIAGAAIVVVKDGKILLSKGYGFADVKSKRPMSPETTLLRPGSISKLFTWTAVMQLVERGKLNLDHDVNEYLDFKIPEAFGQPITLRDIMTHTSGFEETFRQLATYKPERLVSLESYVKNTLPPRIYPPGQVTAYSSYATSLAGYIVEHTSHQAFADYVSRNIFAPLGMTDSTFVQPLPPALAGKLSSAYTVASLKPQPFELTNASPAGALSTTAVDMARFMIAHLENGQPGGPGILQPATAHLMHEHQRSEFPGFGGFTLGFMDQTCRGHQIIGHPGSTLFWASELDLILDPKVGFFVSTNSTGRVGSNVALLSGLFHEFLARYFRCGIPSEPVVPTAAADARRVSGIYVPSRRPESTFFRMFNILISPAVTANSDATIEVNLLLGRGSKPARWREIGSLVYREEGGYRRLAFVPDSSSRISYFAVDGDPMLIYQRAPAGQPWIGRVFFWPSWFS